MLLSVGPFRRHLLLSLCSWASLTDHHHYNNHLNLILWLTLPHSVRPRSVVSATLTIENIPSPTIIFRRLFSIYFSPPIILFLAFNNEFLIYLPFLPVSFLSVGTSIYTSCLPFPHDPLSASLTQSMAALCECFVVIPVVCLLWIFPATRS